MEKLAFDTKMELGAAAGQAGAEAIRDTIEAKGLANIILATGASQFDTLQALVAADGVDWSKVAMFHLDEYMGISDDHPASFRKYLRERFVEKVGDLRAVHYVRGDADDAVGECARMGKIILENPIDVALVGIGENGHLAFNDPPADFETDEPYIVVDLDEACRKQQFGEGWFPTLEDVPKRAISMGIRQIMKSKRIIVSVPDARKAQAVRDALEGELSNLCPASILRQHANCQIYLDAPAASLLS